MVTTMNELRRHLDTFLNFVNDRFPSCLPHDIRRVHIRELLRHRLNAGTSPGTLELADGSSTASPQYSRMQFWTRSSNTTRRAHW